MPACSQTLGVIFNRTPSRWGRLAYWAGAFLVFCLPVSGDLELLDLDAFQWDPSVFPESIHKRLDTELVHARWENFRFHAGSNRRIIEMRNQLDFALPVLEAWMGGTLPDGVFVEVLSVPDESLWKSVLAETGGDADGLGFMMGSSIGFFDVPGAGHFGFELFHELVHVYLTEEYGDRFPIWAEEGIAQHFAWKLSSAFSRSEKGVPLRREYPTIATSFGVKKLMRVRSYPDNPEKRRAFYVSSEVFMASLTGLLTEDQYPLLWARLVERPSDLKGILRRLFYWNQSDWKTFENRYSAQMQRILKKSTGDQ